MPHQRISKFWHDERGGLAMLFGLALPVLLLGAGAMMEYASLTSRRAQLQQAADTGALTAARELSLANADDTRVVSVAKSAALASLAGGHQEGSAATVGASVMDKRSGVQVVVNETVVNLMGKVMSLPSSELEARATAKLSGGGRLCVLTLDPNAGAAIRLDTASKLTANGCSVQSNSTDKKSIQVRDSGFLLAERICSSGGYEGRVGANVSPTPLTDCPPIKDPLASRPPPPVPASCDNGSLVPLLPRKINGGNRTLDPGTYCGGLIVTNGANVTLREGTYIFNQGPLVVDKGSTLAGDYVGFYFNGDLATMKLDFDSIINLSAPKTGTMAGLLIYSDPKAVLGNKFKIFSDNARRLLGTIYLPRGDLYVDANKPIADQSAYTVIVARTIELQSGPNLVLNANYGATDVPVPQGVGPTGSTVALSQ
jgi:Flp pilus assembly protein TadG